MGVDVSEAGSQKVCRLCGADCSGRKRAKDAEGRYYCLSCFEERLERVWRTRHESEAIDDENAEADGSLTGSTFGVDQELVASEAGRVETGDNAPSVLCPDCGLAVEPDAVLCVHCGHDFQAGTQLKVHKKVISRERPAIWPTVVGLYCVLFSAAGLFVYGAQLVKAILLAFSEQSASVWLMSIVISVLIVMVALTVLHGLGGVFVWMRIGAGVVLLRYWIGAKLILFTLAVGAAMLGVYAFPEYIAEFAVVREAEARFGAALPDTVDRTLIGVWVWQCAWPILLLLYFQTEQVRKDVVEFDAPLEPSTALYEETTAS